MALGVNSKQEIGSYTRNTVSLKSYNTENHRERLCSPLYNFRYVYDFIQVVSTTGTVGPAKPVELKVAATTAGSVDLTWTAPQDKAPAKDSNGADIQNYMVYFRDGDNNDGDWDSIVKSYQQTI